MRKTTFLLLSTLLFTTPLNAAFEGVFEMKITSSQTTTTGTVFVSQAGVRTEMAVPNPQSKGQTFAMTLLVKSATPDMVYRINDAAKTYSVMDVSGVRAEVSKDDTETYTVKSLGTDRILGYTCKHVLITSSRGGQSEMWTTRDIFGSSSLWESFGRRSSQGGFMKALRDADADGFVLKMVQRSGGKVETTMEVVRAEEKSLPASTFEVPAGYKKEEGLFGGIATMSDLPPEQQKQLDEQLKKLTPEQREMMEKLLKGKLPEKK